MALRPRAVLDTNAILYLLGGRLTRPLPPRFYFASVITEMELLSYPSLDTTAERQIRGFLSEITVVGLTDSVKTTAIIIRRQDGLKLPDAIVVGTAVVLDADLLTNDAHLSKWGKRLEIK
ncbi:MAG: type II toxin-antitoxin system VapC family toxin [Terriglobia bacterium]